MPGLERYRFDHASDLGDGNYHTTDDTTRPGWFWTHTGGGRSFPQETGRMSKGNEYQKLGKGTGEDIGGAFLLQKKSFSAGPRVASFPSPGTKYGAGYLGHGVMPVWEGLSHPFHDYASFPPLDLSESAVYAKRDTLGALGATAISRATPTRSHAGIGVTLGELRRDGLPQIVGRDLLRERCRDYRSYGREYLNVEFGWKPFINDLKKFAKASSESQQIMDRYYAEAGRPIHRSYSFPSADESTLLEEKWQTNYHWTIGGSHIFAQDQDQAGSFWQQSYYELNQRTWFSGEFLYTAPMPSQAQLAQLQEWRHKADILYGVNLDPDTLWNLAPWTWLPDFVVNMGDVVSNISTFITEGDIMRYGYIMRQTTHRRKVVGTFNTDVIGSRVHQASYEVTEKARYRASPFGFGVNPESLTERQWAILVALGLSKGKRSGGNFAV